MIAEENSIYCENRRAWRKWLLENHDKEKGVWLRIYKKQSRIPSIYHDDAINEALCFGWIDSMSKSGDENYRIQFFSKRNAKSKWSKINKAKVEQLITEGSMTEAGLKVIEFAKQSGYWTALDDVENLIKPLDLQTVLDENSVASGYFENFPRSVKKSILQWLQDAKQETTRKKRIIEIVTLAEKNIRANQYTPKEK